MGADPGLPRRGQCNHKDQDPGKHGLKRCWARAKSQDVDFPPLPAEPTAHFPPPPLYEPRCIWFAATAFVVICFSSNGKVIPQVKLEKGSKSSPRGSQTQGRSPPVGVRVHCFAFFY